MEAATAHKPGGQGKPDTVHVTVTFPLGPKPPYKADENRETTVDEIRVQAMDHFEVSDTETTVYYLTHQGTTPAPSTTLGDLAENAAAVQFTLAKRLVQG